MASAVIRSVTTPRDSDLDCRHIANPVGLSMSAFPNGAIFAIEHVSDRGRIMLNQVLGSPIDGGIARLFVRIGGDKPRSLEIVGPNAKIRFGFAADRFVWEGETSGLHHRATLWLAPDSTVWLWRVEVADLLSVDITCDVLLVQDLGLGDRGFVTNNEAYVSQYIDHYVAQDPNLGHVIMSRQNLAQGGRYPWIMQGCLDGAAGFATDAMQLFGPAYRDRGSIDYAFGGSLPSQKLQHEVACVSIQSRETTVPAGSSATWTFFGLYEANHPDASSAADSARIDAVRLASCKFTPKDILVKATVRNIVQDASPITADSMNDAEIANRYAERLHEERKDGSLLSFFVPDGHHNRHVVLAEKERIVVRRHGTLLRSGQGMLLDETTLCATCWMHGIFGAQLTIGNTSLHKLFSVSRDPYNITRSSGLRILMDMGGDWRLLAVPTAFEMGLSDCCWIYRLGASTITVRVAAAGDDAAMQWQVIVEGPACRFLLFGHLVLGERELAHSGRIEIDEKQKRFSFQPDPDSLWGQRYPEAVYSLVTSTPDAIEAIGGDELLYLDGISRGGPYIALRTRATNEFRFAVTGSLRDRKEAERVAGKYTTGVDSAAMLAPARRYWDHITRGLRIEGSHPDAAALNTIFPWLAHNAMIHLTVPHGLEQYTGAAWGTRDVCQGPVEFLLSLEHDAPVKEILRIVFAQQYEKSGDWPQWFMLEPYSNIQDKHSHGDVIVWPLKALCDYLEWTNDLAFLDERIAWRNEDTLARTERRRSGCSTCQENYRHGRRALHPGNETHTVWRGRLERFTPACRSQDARLDGEQLDGRFTVSATQTLCRGATPGGPRGGSQIFGNARRGDSGGLQ